MTLRRHDADVNPWQQHKPNVLRQFIGYTYSFQLLHAILATLTAGYSVAWSVVWRSWSTLGVLSEDPIERAGIERTGLGLALTLTIVVYYLLALDLDRFVSYRARHFLWDFLVSVFCFWEGRLLVQPFNTDAGDGLGAVWVVAAAVYTLMCARLVVVARSVSVRTELELEREKALLGPEVRGAFEKQLEADRLSIANSRIAMVWLLVAALSALAGSYMSEPRFSAIDTMRKAMLFSSWAMVVPLLVLWRCERSRILVHPRVRRFGWLLWIANFSLGLALVVLWAFWPGWTVERIVALRGAIPFSVLVLTSFGLLVLGKVVLSVDRRGLGEALRSIGRAIRVTA